MSNALDQTFTGPSPSLLAEAVKPSHLTLELLLSAIDRMQNGFAIYDGDFGLLFANKAARRFWPEFYEQLEMGLERREAVLVACRKINPDLSEAEVTKLAEYYYEVQSSSDPRDLKTAGGRNVRAFHEPLGTDAILGFCIDVTELRGREHELKVAKLAAENANQAKSAFLANMSHEIRTPLNGILGLANVLESRLEDPDHKDIIQTLTRSAEVLHAILEDILDVSKIEAGKMAIVREPGCLRETVSDARSLWHSIAVEKGLTLKAEIRDNVPKNIVFDGLRVRQCISNLISNAIKFTEDGEVNVTVDYASTTDGAGDICIAVQDTGRGIPEDKISELFEPFSQIDEQLSRNTGGIGLGLSIVHSLATMMGGSLSCESTEGMGTTFTLQFHAEVAVYAHRTDKIQPDLLDLEHLAGIRVLIADDLPTNRYVTRCLLEPLGVTCVEASTGADVIALLENRDARDADLSEQGPFDLILMDNRMPVVSGLEATRRIRSSRANFRSIPIIALTADAMIGERERLNKLGADGYVSKPFKPALLFQEIDRVLRAAAQTSDK